MPEFDSKNFDPPAPVAYVTLRHPATGATVSDVPMLIDTGADVTFLPRKVIEQLNIAPIENKVYEVEGFTGGTALVEVVRLKYRSSANVSRGNSWRPINQWGFSAGIFSTPCESFLTDSTGIGMKRNSICPITSPLQTNPSLLFFPRSPN